MRVWQRNAFCQGRLHEADGGWGMWWRMFTNLTTMECHWIVWCVLAYYWHCHIVVLDAIVARLRGEPLFAYVLRKNHAHAWVVHVRAKCCINLYWLNWGQLPGDLWYHSGEWGGGGGGYAYAYTIAFNEWRMRGRVVRNAKVVSVLTS